MIFGKKRVEEDLDRIRRANLPPEKFKEDNRKNNNEEIDFEEKIKLEKNDILAMILAVFSLILPYIILFLAIIGLFIYLLYKFFM